MDFWKRIGTDRHKFKVQFFIGRVVLNKKLKGDVSITIKRGDHKVNSEKKLQLEDDGSCDFGKEILSFDALTLFFDQDEKRYQQKTGEIRIIFTTTKGDKKLLGAIEFDVAEYANKNKQTYIQAKKIPGKLQVLFEYQVFIKYIGQASQTSKSMDKKIQKDKDKKKEDRESSLTKFKDFFKSHPDQPESTKPKNQKQKPSEKNNKQKQKSLKEKGLIEKSEKPKKKNMTNPNHKTEHKPPHSQSVSSEQQEIVHKNKVKRNLAGTMSEWEQQKARKKDEKYMTDHGSSASSPPTPMYFDQHYSNQEKKHHKMKKTEKYTGGQTQKVRLSQEGDSQISHQKIDSGVKLKPFNLAQSQKNTEYDNKQSEVNLRRQIDSLRVQLDFKDKELQKSGQEIKQLREKLKRVLKENEELNSEMVKIEEQKEQLIKKVKEGVNSRALFETERDLQVTKSSSKNKLNEQRVKALERQKGELLIKIQNLKEKHAKQIEKYEREMGGLEEENNQLKASTSGQLVKMKEHFVEYQQKYNKLLQKYEERANEAKKAKKEAEETKEQLAEAQNSLSSLKIRIGQQLNDANEDADRSVINILTDLLN